MASIDVTPTTLHIRLSRTEKILGLLRDLDAPRSAITSVTTVPAGLDAVRGLRAPGLGLPGLRAIGTWRRRGEKTYVSVRRGQPAVRVTLSGQRFDAALIGTDDPERVAAGLRPAG